MIKDYGNATVNAEYVLAQFNDLKKKDKIKILEKALRYSLDKQAGTREYAIARAMNYVYQDNGTYLKPGNAYAIIKNNI